MKKFILSISILLSTQILSAQIDYGHYKSDTCQVTILEGYKSGSTEISFLFENVKKGKSYYTSYITLNDDLTDVIVSPGICDGKAEFSVKQVGEMKVLNYFCKRGLSQKVKLEAKFNSSGALETFSFFESVPKVSISSGFYIPFFVDKTESNCTDFKLEQ